MRKPFLLALTLGAVALPGAASAAIVGAAVQHFSAFPDNVVEVDTGVSSAQVNFSTTAKGMALSGIASTTDANGAITLHAASSLTGTSSASITSPAVVAADAVSGYQDNYLVTGGSGSGTLVFRASYHGSFSAQGPARAQSNASFVGCLGTFNPNTGPCTDANTTNANTFLIGRVFATDANPVEVSNGPVSTVTVPFTFGTPFDATFYLITGAVLGTSPAGSSVNISTDFSNTATLGAFIVKDAAGNPINASVVSTLNGRSYAVAVPEPATWAMMVAGLGLLGAAARRRAPAPGRA